jgi:hypothetical protein
LLFQDYPPSRRRGSGAATAGLVEPAAVTLAGAAYTPVAIAKARDDTAILGAKSASGTCFYIKDQASPGTSTSPGTLYAKNTTCTAPGSTTVAGSTW